MNLKYLITKKFKNWIIFILVRFFFSIIQNFPRRLAFGLLTGITLLCYKLIPDARKKTIRNLTLVFGAGKNEDEIRKMARQVFRNLGRNAVDMLRLKKLLGKDPFRFVKLIGREHFDAALAKGKGIIVLTGHIGCWELMAGFFASIGYNINVVGTPLYDPRLDRMLVENRTSVGVKNIVRDTGIREILKILKGGDVIGILIDQDTKVDGEFVNFFGQPAFTPVAPVTLALKMGAAIVPMSIHIQDDNTHLVEVEPALEIEETGDKKLDRIKNLEKCSLAVERMILKDPTQWVWMHDRWKTRPPQTEQA